MGFNFFGFDQSQITAKMARIIYSISGEGMGHAMRSKPILDYLTRKHKLKIFSSGRAYSYLSKIFQDVNEIQGVYMKYRKNSVNELGTVICNLFNVPKMISSFGKLKRAIKSFNPDMIISDYEAISAYAGLFNKIPVISVDNQHIFDKTNLKFPKKYFMNYIETRLVDRMIIPRAKYHFITTFFNPKLKSGNVFLVPPVLRDEIIRMKTKEKGYFLVYQTSETNHELIETLKKIGENFIVYGFNKNKKEKNIIFKKSDEIGFFKDLSGCRAVIINGGFTLMSEAIYLRKPVLSIPVKRQFEQIINAIYLDKLGYGKFIKEANQRQIMGFIKSLGKYKDNLKQYKKQDNSKLFDKLDSVIKGISS